MLSTLLELGYACTNSGAPLIAKRPCICTSLSQVRGRSTMSRIGNRVKRQQCRHEAYHEGLHKGRECMWVSEVRVETQRVEGRCAHSKPDDND